MRAIRTRLLGRRVVTLRYPTLPFRATRVRIFLRPLVTLQVGHQSGAPLTFEVAHTASKTRRALVPVLIHVLVQTRLARALVTADHAIELLRAYFGCVSSVPPFYMRVQSRQSITVEIAKRTDVFRAP